MSRTFLRASSTNFFAAISIAFDSNSLIRRSSSATLRLYCVQCLQDVAIGWRIGKQIPSLLAAYSPLISKKAMVMPLSSADDAFLFRRSFVSCPFVLRSLLALSSVSFMTSTISAKLRHFRNCSRQYSLHFLV